MAIDSATTRRPSPELLTAKYAKVGAVASIIGAVLAIVVLAVVAFGPAGDDPTVAAPIFVWLLMFVASIAVAAALLSGKLWAQQVLLAFWELLGIGSVCVLLGIALQESPQQIVLGPGVMAGVLVASGVISGLLIAASRAHSRLRYGTVATSAAAVAIALMLAVNIVAQHDYFRTSVESYGIYGLAGRTQKVIDGLEKPVKLTCIYGPGADSDIDYGGRTFELLTEMAEYASRRGKQLHVSNAVTDAAKNAILAELESKVVAKAQGHITYLRTFVAAGPQLAAQLNSQAEQWQKLPSQAYVNQWNISAEARGLADDADKLSALQAKLARLVGSATGPGQFAPQSQGLQDYGELVEDTEAALLSARRRIEGMAGLLRQIRSLSEAAAANRPGVIEAVGQLNDTVQALAQAVGSPEDAPPADPGEMMADFVDRSQLVAQRAMAVAQRLNTFAGPDGAPMLRASRAWWLEMSDGQGGVVRNLPTAAVALLGQRTAVLAENVKATLGAATDEYIAEQVTPLREQVALHTEDFADAASQTLAAVDRLTDVDQASARIMALTETGRLMRDMLATLDDLLNQAGRLPPLEDQTLPKDLARKNIVIVEIGDDIEIIPFRAVWPMSGDADPTEPQARQARLFNGNAAISSKLLFMTTRPLATVIVTYYRPAGDILPADIELSDLTGLYSRLSENNIEVGFWNLVSPIPNRLAGGTDGGTTYSNRPAVLLVLPPRPTGISLPDRPAPSFGPHHLARLKKVIDNGTPAIFLASFMAPRLVPTPYQYEDYLRSEWGIHVRSDYLIVPAQPDSTTPGEFTLTPHWVHMPLNLFADHPIGNPITGQQTLWLYCCPIEIADALPPRVTVEPLLAIPPSWGRFTWATANARQLMAQANLGLVHPNYEQGDLPVPDDDIGMPLAVAASRLARPGSDDPARPSQGVNPVRLVVMSMGMSFIDGYMDMPPRGAGDDMQTVGDAPRANADLMINSVLWTIGRDDLIAAGPPRAKPIRAISTATGIMLQLLCVVVLPIAIMAIGGAVMVVRRR